MAHEKLLGLDNAGWKPPTLPELEDLARAQKWDEIGKKLGYWDHLETKRHRKWTPRTEAKAKEKADALAKAEQDAADQLERQLAQKEEKNRYSRFFPSRFLQHL